MAYSEFLWLLDESQETKIKTTNMLRQNPSCLTGFCVQLKTQRILFLGEHLERIFSTSVTTTVS